jgi:hypothetical protein
MIVSQAQLTIADHYISIAQDDRGHVYCFKHTASESEWEYFENLDTATDYIFSRIAQTKYVLDSRD